MFEIYDKVRIKQNNIIGTIVDVSSINSVTTYIVESDVKYTSDGYGDKWKLYDSTADDIEKV